MNALAMAGYFCLLSWNRFDGPAWVLPAVFAIWFTTCTLSRFYMGAHSPADVVAGLALGMAGLAVNLAFGDAVDAWVLSSPHVWWVVPLVVACLMYVYPRAKRPAWTSSPGDTAIIEGVACGVILGIHAQAAAHSSAIGQRINFTGVSAIDALSATLACVLGFAILVVVRTVVKTVTAPLLLAFWGQRWGPIEDLLSAAEIGEAEKRELAALDAALKPAIFAASPPNDDADPTTTSPASGGAAAPSANQAESQALDGSANTSPRNASSPSSESKDTDPCNDVATVPAVVPDGVRQRVSASTETTALQSSKTTPVPAASTSQVTPTIVGSPPTGGLVLLPPSRRYEIELPLKLITYFAVGFNAVYTVPLLFQYLGLAQYGMVRHVW